MDLNSDEVSALARIVEEATRADPKTVARFVEPAHGTLDRAMSARPHIVFGRRGSGKSSLLRKAYAVLSLERRPAAYVDLEAFKGHSYPDVLLSVLISSLSSFEEWLQTTGSYSAAKKSWWERIFGTKPTEPPIDKARLATVQGELGKIKGELEALLYASDGAAIDTRVKTQEATTEASTDKLKVSNALSVGGAGAKLGLGAELATSDSVKETREATVEQREHRLERPGQARVRGPGAASGGARVRGHPAGRQGGPIDEAGRQHPRPSARRPRRCRARCRKPPPGSGVDQGARFAALGAARDGKP
jgi:hypothetical protein